MKPVASRLLRWWRLRTKKTQSEAAALLDVRQATWSEYESGRKTPRTKAALDLVTVTGGAVPIEEWGREETEEEHLRPEPTEAASAEEESFPEPEPPPASESAPKSKREAAVGE